MNVVNWRMLQHPLNWLTVILMLIIASIAGHLLLSLFGHEPDGAQPLPQYQPAAPAY